MAKNLKKNHETWNNGIQYFIYTLKNVWLQLEIIHIELELNKRTAYSRYIPMKTWIQD